VGLFLITFLTTRERILPDPTQKSDPKRDFGALLKNGPWIAMFVLTLSHFIMLAMRGGTMFYYFQYYVDQNRLYSLLESLGLSNANSYLLNVFGLIVDAKKSNVASVGFSLLNITTQLVTVVGVLCSTFLAKRFGKKAVALVGFSLTTVFMAAFFLLPPESIGAIYWMEYLRALTYAPTIPLIWAMFADVADYSEWKTGRRTTGVIYATILFGLKTGLSLGGAIAGWLLSGYGYRPNGIQTPLALQGIRMTISIFPSIFFLIVIICLTAYRINKKLNLQIQDELAERRSKFAAT